MTRGEVRFFAIFCGVVTGLVLVVIPLFAEDHLGGKIFMLVLYAFFLLCMKDLITGKFWDNIHRNKKTEEAKDGLKGKTGGWTRSDVIVVLALIFLLALAVIATINNIRYFNSG